MPKESPKKRVKKQMTTDMKIFIAVCIVVALILCAAIVYIVMPKDIAVVKDNRVTNDEFTYYYAGSLSSIYYSYYLGLIQIDENSIPDYAKQQALSAAVEREYLLQEAKKAGFTVSKEDLDSAWNEFDAKLKEYAGNVGTSVEKYSKDAYGVKYNKLKEIYKENVIAQKYLEKLLSDMQVDEQELKAYYEENKDTFNYNTVRHILIKCDENADEATVEEKKKLAQSILDRVNNGEDFAELAKEYSEDGGSKDNGGLYDVKKGQMVKEFEDWTFSHNVGDTGLIKTKYGFHVMKLEGISNTFEALKDTIEESYKENKYQKTLQEALNNGEYKVEVKDAYYDFSGIK